MNGLNSSTEWTKETISELDDGSIEIIQSEQETEK